jgi:hypothetical protein
MLTQKRLKELLHYNPNTGIFTWKVSGICNENAKSGSVAGVSCGQGYICTTIYSTQYSHQRLAWLYVYGYLPENIIDHKDRIKHHNWINNLREVSRQCNGRNRGNPINNTSGIKGITWCKSSNKWKVQIKVNKRIKYLGVYTLFTDAVCTRLAAEQCLNWEGCDSNSPAYQYVQRMLRETT